MHIDIFIDQKDIGLKESKWGDRNSYTDLGLKQFKLYNMHTFKFIF